MILNGSFLRWIQVQLIQQSFSKILLSVSAYNVPFRSNNQLNPNAVAFQIRPQRKISRYNGAFPTGSVGILNRWGRDVKHFAAFRCFG